MSHPIPRSRLAALLTTLAVLLAACGGPADQAGSDDAPGDTNPPAEGDVGYNDADLSFLQGMIPHHEQAVTMAEMVPDRTDRPELLAFAEDIIEMQQEEISQMQTMLDEAGMDGHAGGHDGGMQDMAGMMSEERMTELEGLQDQEFDLLFLDMMTEHHQGAVDASEDVLEEGDNPEVRALAQEIITAQQDEIEQMSAWRAEWAG